MTLSYNHKSIHKLSVMISLTNINI